MRWVLLVIASTGLAAADSEIAIDGAAVAKPVKRARACADYTTLIGQDPEALAHVMTKHGLKPIVLEAVEVPESAVVGMRVAFEVVTLRIGKRQLRGILGAVVGCVKPNIRHAVDDVGGIYHFDGPAGVVDYATQQCTTPSGRRKCSLQGNRNVLWVIKDPNATLVGQFGSNLTSFFPTR
jgi:hypothetical protein